MAQKTKQKSKKGKVLFSILFVAAMLVGLGLVFYPHLSFWLAKRNQTYVVQNYDATMANLEKERLDKEWQRAIEYNQSLVFGTLDNPYSGAQEGKNTYLSILNFEENGMMGHVRVPKIDVDLPIFHTASDSILQLGVGHLEGSALPVGGEGTHTLLTAHTGLNVSKMLSDLDQVEIGDEFYLYILDRILAYRVIDINIIEPEDISLLKPVSGKDLATLITCTPYGVNSHRLLVTGERVEYSPQDITQRIEQTNIALGRETLLLIAGVSAIAFMLVLGLVVFLVLKRKQKNEKNKKRVQRIQRKNNLPNRE